MNVEKYDQSSEDVLTLFMRRSADGALAPLSVSFGGGDIRVRYGFRPGLTLEGALDARFVGVVAEMAARGDAAGALRLPETDLEVNGVSLRGSHVIVAPGLHAAESVTLRFERCRGDVRRLLRRAALPALACDSASEDVDAALLREIVIPLLNLRRHVAAAPPEAADSPAQAYLRSVAERIGDIEDRYLRVREGDAPETPADAPGVRAALERVAAQAPSCVDCLAGRRLLARLAA